MKDGQQFQRMPFERTSNTMDGKFNYTELERRLRHIKEALDAETERWEQAGLNPRIRDSTVGVNLARQFEQIRESFKRSDVPHSIELENGNPFVWVLTYFGKPMTNLDGGLFRIKFWFSPQFPEEQPRVKFETKTPHAFLPMGAYNLSTSDLGPPATATCTIIFILTLYHYHDLYLTNIS